ncbi:histone family protein DNA-binding protein [Acidithiobacillus ferrivorans SS3]|uniref:Histone family protein DNA-binding protein n=1 Tax=Acidithiobacillus ferrivorans SS3 TaxID=743299 RepID=G0JLH6_9PROT|nr:histone family protein DNA-binding protein [Acidithiobacillus ferrivorans SS3]
MRTVWRAYYPRHRWTANSLPLDNLHRTTAACERYYSSLFPSGGDVCFRTTLASGENVKLSGFGSFILLHKNARPGRNPTNMDMVEISARRVVTYRSSQIVRGKANG